MPCLGKHHMLTRTVLLSSMLHKRYLCRSLELAIIMFLSCSPSIYTVAALRCRSTFLNGLPDRGHRAIISFSSFLKS